jgi:hypothetical protein
LLVQADLIRPGRLMAPEPLENASLLNALRGTIDLNPDGTALASAGCVTPPFHRLTFQN